MSRRRLNDEERALWKVVTRAIVPLRKGQTGKPGSDESPPDRALANARLKPGPDLGSGLGPAFRIGSKAAPTPASSVTAKSSVPPLAPLGRQFRRQLARGSRAIDGRLDLHGMTQTQAHDALLGFLGSMQARGGKVVLVITGKGLRGGEAYSERGVLKRQVPLWLRLPEFRRHIAGFESAGIGHGGDGALYITLRRARAD